MHRRAAAFATLCLLTVACGLMSGGSQGPAETTLRNFVKPLYAHGVPYAAARDVTRDPHAEQLLLSWLDDPGMADHRNNIMLTLGILGSQAAIRRIKTTIEMGSGALSRDEVSVRMDGVTAMGYAAYVASTTEALDYLSAGSKLDYWKTHIKWTLTGGGDPGPRLRSRTIAALGLSASPAALLTLRDLLQTTLSGGGGGGRGGGGSPVTAEMALITEGIDTNQYIAANGMRKYYETFLR